MILNCSINFLEHNFFVYSSSNIAASSIAASLNGMNWHRRTGITSMELYNLLTDWTGLKQVNIYFQSKTMY